MEEYLEAFGAGSAGEPIPHIVEGDAKLLGYYKEGLKEYETDIAIADAENGLAYGGWAFGFAEYWTIEDSEATWERIGQRRNELLEAYAELQQGVGRAHAEIPSMESAIDAAGRSASDDAARSPNQAAEATYQASTREDAVVRHGEKAVATGERLLERLVEAGREMRDSEARLGRYREGDEERDARFEKLVEATSSYNRILGQAVREAVDGNGYIREARWHRDLETAIAMEDLRHEQRDQFHIQNEEFRSRQSDPTEQAFQAGNTGRPEAHQQHMTRLRQIEQEIQDRDRTDRDERDR
jgi:hypothetical protein